MFRYNMILQYAQQIFLHLHVLQSDCFHIESLGDKNIFPEMKLLWVLLCPLLMAILLFPDINRMYTYYFIEYIL